MQSKISTLAGYPGNKSSSAIYPMIINRIPAHNHWFELYGGSAQITQKLHFPSGVDSSLYPAAGVNVHVNELHDQVRDLLRDLFPPSVAVTDIPAVQFLQLIQSMCVSGILLPQDVFVYLDPPYLHSTRVNGSDYYLHEMEESDHVSLLEIIQRVDFKVMISHYPCKLYDRMLPDWFMCGTQVATRAEIAVEGMYMNYDINDYELHDYRYIGYDRTDRQRINRQIGRIASKIDNLPTRVQEKLMRVLTKNKQNVKI